MKMTIEKAIKILEDEKEESCLLESYGDGDTEWAKAYNMAIYALKHKPKTGQWIIIDDCELFMAKCSECGEIVDSRMISKYPYSHCGAKMESDIHCTYTDSEIATSFIEDVEAEQNNLWMYMIFNENKIKAKTEQWAKEAEEAGMTLTEFLESISPLNDKEKLSWIGKSCKDCGNEKCKKLGTLPKGYDCALWQAENEVQK